VPNLPAKARKEGRKSTMKKFIPIICISIVALSTAKAQDPAKVDPAHYKVILNNSQVRILDIHQKPGEKSPMHSHPNHVVYSFNGETLKFTLPDGTTKTATIKAGQAISRNAETHTVENIGENEAHALDIELKEIIPKAKAVRTPASPK
jgi:quercetin dioxygenase-like cupin family protein